VTDDHQSNWKELHDVVNMAAGELEKWLSSDDSRGVGQKKNGGESTGHESGRPIVEILRTKK
jgi:hypothetical protein